MMRLVKDDTKLNLKSFYFKYTEDNNGKLIIQYEHDDGVTLEFELGEMMIKDCEISEDKKNLIIPIKPMDDNIGYVRNIPSKDWKGSFADINELINI